MDEKDNYVLINFYQFYVSPIKKQQPFGININVLFKQVASSIIHIIYFTHIVFCCFCEWVILADYQS